MRSRCWMSTGQLRTNPECGVGIYVQLSIADFYQEIQKAAEQKMQTITLQDIIDRYGKKLDELEQKAERDFTP